MKPLEPHMEVEVATPPRCRICGDFLMQDGKCMGLYVNDVNSIRAHRNAKGQGK